MFNNSNNGGGRFNGPIMGPAHFNTVFNINSNGDIMRNDGASTGLRVERNGTIFRNDGVQMGRIGDNGNIFFLGEYNTGFRATIQPDYLRDLHKPMEIKRDVLPRYEPVKIEKDLYNPMEYKKDLFHKTEPFSYKPPYENHFDSYQKKRFKPRNPWDYDDDNHY